jgi:hypothetical protein
MASWNADANASGWECVVAAAVPCKHGECGCARGSLRRENDAKGCLGRLAQIKFCRCEKPQTIVRHGLQRSSGLHQNDFELQFRAPGFFLEIDELLLSPFKNREAPSLAHASWRRLRS